MRKIEIWSISGESRRLLSEMCFISEREFQIILARVLSCQPFNSLRRGRYNCCYIKRIDNRGIEFEYFSEKPGSCILNRIDEYNEVFMRAMKIAKSRCWGYAWKYSTEAWQIKAVLKRMPAARRSYEKESIMVHQ